MKTGVVSLMAFILLNSGMGFKKNEVSLDKSPVVLPSRIKKLSSGTYPDSILIQWIDYYKEREPDFSLTGFEWRRTDSLLMMPGHVLANFDKDFDTIYTDFLIYNPARSLYLDFDSFCWSLDESGKPSFAADQEINVIDLEKRTIPNFDFG